LQTDFDPKIPREIFSLLKVYIMNKIANQIDYIHQAKLARRRARRAARKESYDILTALKAASPRLNSKEFQALFNKLV